jgi:hypothetical protein
MTGFGSYCDEFGSHKNPAKTVMGIAGLLAWSRDWTAFANEWREIQTQENLPTFHMTDFVHQKKSFDNQRWKLPEERKRILNLLLNAIGQAKAVPVSAAVVLKDFDSLTEDQRNKLVSPYHTAFQEVTFNLAFAAANKALQSAKTTDQFFGNTVAMVYAKLKKFTGPAEELWDAVKLHNRAAGNWMGSFTSGEPTDHPALQAADIWAYSLGHMIEHKPPKKVEADIAFEFFVSLTWDNQKLGHKFFTRFDRNEMLMRLGEVPKY